MTSWISVDDRLPESKEYLSLLVYSIYGEVRGDAYWMDGYGFGLDEGCQPLTGITHWQPLPAPPEDNK